MNSCKYPSLEKITINDIFSKIFEKKYNSDTEFDMGEYLDLLEEALVKMFYEWYTKRIRMEQRGIRRQYKEITACELCGKTGKIEVHHKIPVRLFGGNERENILFLCPECHKSMR